MTYALIITSHAERQIRKLERQTQAAIGAAVLALRDNPRPPQSIRMAGATTSRLRVGNYRVLFTIDDVIKTITVIEVGHRRDVYRQK